MFLWIWIEAVFDDFPYTLPSRCYTDRLGLVPTLQLLPRWWYNFVIDLLE